MIEPLVSVTAEKDPEHVAHQETEILSRKDDPELARGNPANRRQSSLQKTVREAGDEHWHNHRRTKSELTIDGEVNHHRKHDSMNNRMSQWKAKRRCPNDRARSWDKIDRTVKATEPDERP
jgi:hypothetical protein